MAVAASPRRLIGLGSARGAGGGAAVVERWRLRSGDEVTAPRAGERPSHGALLSKERLTIGSVGSRPSTATGSDAAKGKRSIVDALMRQRSADELPPWQAALAGQQPSYESAVAKFPVTDAAVGRRRLITCGSSKTSGDADFLSMVPTAKPPALSRNEEGPEGDALAARALGGGQHQRPSGGPPAAAAGPPAPPAPRDPRMPTRKIFSPASSGITSPKNGKKSMLSLVERGAGGGSRSPPPPLSPKAGDDGLDGDVDDGPSADVGFARWVTEPASLYTKVTGLLARPGARALGAPADAGDKEDAEEEQNEGAGADTNGPPPPQLKIVEAYTGESAKMLLALPRLAVPRVAGKPPAERESPSLGLSATPQAAAAPAVLSVSGLGSREAEGKPTMRRPQGIRGGGATAGHADLGGPTELNGEAPPAQRPGVIRKLRTYPKFTSTTSSKASTGVADGAKPAGAATSRAPSRAGRVSLAQSDDGRDCVSPLRIATLSPRRNAADDPPMGGDGVSRGSQDAAGGRLQLPGLPRATPRGPTPSGCAESADDDLADFGSMRSTTALVASLCVQIRGPRGMKRIVVGKMGSHQLSYALCKVDRCLGDSEAGSTTDRSLSPTRGSGAVAI